MLEKNEKWENSNKKPYWTVGFQGVGGEAGIWTLATIHSYYSLSRGAPSASWVLLQKNNKQNICLSRGILPIDLVIIAHDLKHCQWFLYKCDDGFAPYWRMSCRIIVKLGVLSYFCYWHGRGFQLKYIVYSYNYTLQQNHSSKAARLRVPLKGNKHGSVTSIVIRFLLGCAVGAEWGNKSWVESEEAS